MHTAVAGAAAVVFCAGSVHIGQLSLGTEQVARADDSGGTCPVGGSGPTTPAATRQREGGQRLNGYVPAPGLHDYSGVTVASGLDLGQQNQAGLEAMGLPDSIVSELSPYLGLQGQAARDALADQPLSISQSDADTIDAAVQQSENNYISNAFDRDSARNGGNQTFSSLPTDVQDAITSLAHQLGHINRRSDTAGFWNAITSGDWDDAAADMRTTGPAGYGPRRNSEADQLQRGIDAGGLSGDNDEDNGQDDGDPDVDDWGLSAVDDLGNDPSADTDVVTPDGSAIEVAADDTGTGTGDTDGQATYVDDGSGQFDLDGSDQTDYGQDVSETDTNPLDADIDCDPDQPSDTPTDEPTDQPSDDPTDAPTDAPSDDPSDDPGNGDPSDDPGNGDPSDDPGAPGDPSDDPGVPGDPDPGNGDPGDPDPGDPGAGDPGDPGAGDPGAGDPGSGGDGGGGDGGGGGGGGGFGGGGCDPVEQDSVHEHLIHQGPAHQGPAHQIVVQPAPRSEFC